MAEKFSYSFYYPYQIIKTYIRIKGGDEALVTYYENADDPDNDFGAEYYQGKNYIIGTENPSYSRNFKQFKGLPRGLQYIIDELQKEHKNFDWESIKGKSLGESQNQYPTLEDFLNEAKKKPTTKKGKSKKFEKVMHEFGKGKLKPFHADKPLKSKKQDGTEAERTQALAIAFSEAGIKVPKSKHSRAKRVQDKK